MVKLLPETFPDSLEKFSEFLHGVPLVLIWMGLPVRIDVKFDVAESSILPKILLS